MQLIVTFGFPSKHIDLFDCHSCRRPACQTAQRHSDSEEWLRGRTLSRAAESQEGS